MAAAREILRKTFSVGSGTLVSRITGLLRDMALASAFGTGAAMSMFVMAFTVPNLFRRLFGEGALNSAFIPVFTAESLRDGGDPRRLLNAVMTGLTALLGVLCLIGWAVCLAALLSGRLPENGRLFFILLAICLPYLPLICLTAVQSAALNVRGHFMRPAFAPALMNLCQIVAAIWFKRYGITVLAWSALISGVLQFAWQAQILWRSRLQFQWVWELAHPGLRKVVALMGPMVLGLGAIQINTFVDQLIAQFVVPHTSSPYEGANGVLNFANHLMQFPLGVLGIALATAVFPAFARHAHEGDRKGMVESLNLSFRAALFLSLPCVVMFTLFAEPIVRVLFQSGKFDPVSTARTARTLFCFSLGLWAFCAVQVLARVFYAQQDMGTPVRIAATMVGLNLALNLTLVWPLQEAGLALSSSICGVGNMALLLWVLRKRMGLLGGRKMLTSGLRIAAASALAGACGYAVGRGCGLFEPGDARKFVQAMQLAAALGATSAAFLAACWALRVRELREFASALFTREARA